MNSRTAWTCGALALAAGAAGISAAGAENFTEWAPVISSTPVVQRINQPREECWNETITTSEVRRLGHRFERKAVQRHRSVPPIAKDPDRCCTARALSERYWA